jgi:hypothetical protein
MRIRLLGTALLLSGALAIPATPVFAQGRGRGAQERYQGQKKDKKRGHEHAREREHERDRNHHRHHRDRRYFRDRDRGVIVSYYRQRRSHLPPGLARRGSLPPGLQRQLVRNGHLPYGLQKRIVWFPRDLDRRLGPLPYGYRRCWVGNNVLIVNPKTFAIVEIIQGISILAH